MADYLKFILLAFNLFFLITCDDNIDKEINMVLRTGSINAKNIHVLKDFVLWANATVPFYIDTNHFDSEQSMLIMRSLAFIAYKTCLKFAPVMAKPDGNQHVMVFENPNGIKNCNYNIRGHSVDEPHIIVLGYNCLRSPDIEMSILRGLGLPFEHNRPVRNIYVSINYENIEPGYMELFTQDGQLPAELRALPYDVNSVMHFSERAFTKNGHRTIMFKDHRTKQHRDGLSSTDIRKIEIIYGPECRIRDRQEKIELCQSYPGVARRKREIVLPMELRSLRVNPNITPPPSVIYLGNVSNTLLDLSVESNVQEIVDQINQISDIALKRTRGIYCNITKKNLRADDNGIPIDMLGIVEAVSDYVKSITDHAIANLTSFCKESESSTEYKNRRQQNRCPFFDKSDRCRQRYKSTASWLIKTSTTHGPFVPTSTNVYITQKLKNLLSIYNNVPRRRTGNDTVNLEDFEKATKKAQEVLPVSVTETTEKYRLGEAEVIIGNDSVVELSKVKVAPGKEKASQSARRIINMKIRVPRSPRKRKHSTEKSERGTKKHSKKNTKRKRPQRLHQKKQKRYRVDKTETEEEDEEVDEDTKNREIEAKKKSARLREGRGSYLGQDGQPNQEEEDPEAPNEPEPEEVEEVITNEDVSDGGNHPVGVPGVVDVTRRNRDFYNDRIWPNGIVYYVISTNHKYDMDIVRAQLGEVNQILVEKTCVKLQEIRPTQANKYEDYLFIDTSPDFVTGRVGGKQVFGVLELFQGGQHRQYAAMMVMAMLGFYFEVSRHDRDQFIKVHSRHVRPDKLHHYEKIRSDATFQLPYDYKSATHPSWQFWRHVGKTGISTVATFKEKDPDGKVMKELGQHEELLSELDLVKINSIYGIKCFKPTRDSQNRRTTKKNV